jgi:hypothetical protein
MLLDAEAVQDVAFIVVHASFTACPKWIVDACAGALNITLGMGDI